MNDTQNVFIVFYAILWGTAANSQPRWKAFQLPLFFMFKQVTCRVILSFVLLNIAPILYFGWTIWMLSGSHLYVTNWNPQSVGLLLVHSVIPAFAVFGFYRMWIGVIELKPDVFYFDSEQQLPERFRKVEPSIDELKIRDNVGPNNIFWASVYILTGLLCSQILR